MTDPALLTGVRLLSLDAGNTVIFLDHARLARIATDGGFAVEGDALVRSEGRAKRRADPGAARGLLEVAWASSGQPGARTWGMMIATILEEAGAPPEILGSIVEAVWRQHCVRNLWSIVADGLEEALDAFRACGGKVAVVSNSEGMLERLFGELGLAPHVDLLVDSAVVGFEKPDPRIFQVAMERLGVGASEALHLGDMFATDILGARACGMRAALVDPYAHWEGAHAGVPRVEGATEVAWALARGSV